MKITLNGKKKQYEAALTLEEMIRSASVDFRHVIAEVNGEIVKQGDWGATPIQEGDTIELLNFVGGG